MFPWGYGIKTTEFLSTLSVRRATMLAPKSNNAGGISIHALREESDERTVGVYQEQGISIHALREESDGVPVPALQGLPYFYPRSP